MDNHDELMQRFSDLEHKMNLIHYDLDDIQDQLDTLLEMAHHIIERMGVNDDA